MQLEPSAIAQNVTRMRQRLDMLVSVYPQVQLVVSSEPAAVRALEKTGYPVAPQPGSHTRPRKDRAPFRQPTVSDRRAPGRAGTGGSSALCRHRPSPVTG